MRTYWDWSFTANVSQVQGVCFRGNETMPARYLTKDVTTGKQGSRPYFPLGATSRLLFCKLDSLGGAKRREVAKHLLFRALAQYRRKGKEEDRENGNSVYTVSARASRLVFHQVRLCCIRMWVAWTVKSCLHRDTVSQPHPRLFQKETQHPLQHKGVSMGHTQ
jgi:hypothetical protein